MYSNFFKPVLDFLLALFLVILLLPIFIVVALLIYIKLGRPILFAQERPGKDEKIFGKDENAF